MHDVYTTFEEDLNVYIEGLDPLPGQLGIGIIDNGYFACMDIFGQPGYWSRCGVTA
ncbi:MAG: ARPP-1 family domain-containing protein [Syntrophothermaceae bacterium]|jgi:hypothetical protein